MKKFYAAALVCLLASVSSASAKTMSDLVKEIKAGDPDVLYALQVTGEAYMWANTQNLALGQRPLYCPPDSLAITGEQYGSFLIDYVKHFYTVKDFPSHTYQLHLLKALSDAFPCRQ